jgi:hypothetical protein
VKITIEIDGVPAFSGSSSESGAQSGDATMLQMSASDATSPSLSGSVGLQDLFARAAAMGAINAGPAPAFLDSSSQVPIASSIGEEVASPDDSSSAGAAPEHLFGQVDQIGRADG